MERNHDLYGLSAPPRDPHNVEGRKWFRRVLITLCVVGYALIMLPQEARDRLRWEPRPPVHQIASPTLVKEECVRVRITYTQIAGHRIVDLKFGEVKEGHSIWYDCTQTFSDGSKFRRVGDVKP